MRTKFILQQTVSLLLFFALPSIAAAGVSYRFETVTSGLAGQSISGEVEVEGEQTRVNIEHGDGAAFTDRSFALTSGTGRLLTVVDPSARTFYEISTEDLAGGGALLDQLRSMFGLKVTGVRASARDLGAGPQLEGYPTRHHLLETSCGIAAAGAKSATITFASTTETWWTDRIPASYASALLSRNSRTGLPELDKLIEGQARPAGFPLKQISITKIVQGGAPIEVRATTLVRNIRSRPIPAGRFVLPQGYRKTENPIERAMKAMGR